MISIVWYEVVIAYTIRQLLEIAIVRFVLSDTPRLDAEILLSHVLQVNSSYLIAHADSILDGQVVADFFQLLKKREHGQPIAYLTGSKEFWSLPLMVNENVLIPRPETELLVKEVLLFSQQYKNQELDILDMGTGSGAIALALASELLQAKIVAIDNSEQALRVAKYNADKLDLSHIEFIHSHWFSQLDKYQFDIICCNPPYVDEQDSHLRQDDVRFEPRSALISANQGLFDISYIGERAKRFLKPHARLFFEHGFEQGKATRKILLQFGYNSVDTYIDLNRLERVTAGSY